MGQKDDQGYVVALSREWTEPIAGFAPAWGVTCHNPSLVPGRDLPFLRTSHAGLSYISYPIEIQVV